MTDVTQILAQIDSGDPVAAEKLLPIVYEELRKLAAAKLANEKSGQTLQATALVHEAWLKLVGTELPKNLANRRHFFSAAAESMRQTLVDQARRKLSIKHGGQWHRIPEPQDFIDSEQAPDQTIAIHELLDKFAEKHPRHAEVAKMRLFL